MPKSTGLGDNFYVAGNDLSGDINSLGKIGGGPSLRDLTGINASAAERGGGVRDGRLEFVALWNVDSTRAHPVLSAMPTARTLGSYFRGQALGNAAASLAARQASYSPERNADGDLRAEVALAGDGFGCEWGVQLTAGKRTDSGATNGTGVDLATSTAFGLQAHLHVFAIVGTSVTIKLQESADNGGGDPYADVTGGAFNAVAPAGSPTWQRIATGGSQVVKRWLRVVTTGTFSNATFAVAITKNTVAAVF